MTRRFVWIVLGALILAVLAGGYAWYRNYVAEQLGLALNNWILARTAEGYRIDANIAPEFGGVTTVARQLSDVAIVAPGDAWTLRINRLDVFVSPLNPFGVEFQPDGRVAFAYTVADDDYLLTNDFREGAAGFSYDREGQITSAYLRQSGSRLDGPISVD